MAWHIPEEILNHTPLSKEVVVNKYKECGYSIINYTYKNNQTRILCFDSEGYKVKVSYASLGKVHQYTRFSSVYNLEGFWYNIQWHKHLHPELPEVIEWERRNIGTHGQSHIYLKCKCPTCGRMFWVQFTPWENGEKLRCEYCVRRESNLEIKVREWLQSNNIVFEQQKRFCDCRYKKKLPFDFYLPYYNICIEIDGEQHFKSDVCLHGHFTTEKDLADTQYRDKIKNKYCDDKNIKLIRLKYNVFKNNEFKGILQNEIYNQ